MTPKCPLIEFKRTNFLKNRHNLTPNRDSHKSRLALKKKKKTLFSHFSGHAYTLLFECLPRLISDTILKFSLNESGYSTSHDYEGFARCGTHRCIARFATSLGFILYSAVWRKTTKNETEAMYVGKI